MKISKGIEKLAVDANPILSAIIGGKAREIFLTKNTLFYTTVFNFKEVEKYIPILASRRGIPAEDLYMALSMLTLYIYDAGSYKNRINQANKLIEKRDPKDIHLLALALKIECPIWSNDTDLQGLGVKVYSTMELIRGKD